MDENNKLFYLEQLANLTFDYTYLLKVDAEDKIIPEIIIGSFENITGYALEEIREKNFFLSIIYEEDLLSFLEFWGNIISGKTGTIITRILTKSNEIKWVKNYSKAIIDDKSKNIVMILGAVQDITEQQLMEEVLKETERMHRTLIESMGEGIILADNNDHIIYVNKKIIQMLRYDKREIIGKTGFNFLVKSDDKNLIVGKNRLRESGISDSYETVFIKKNGEELPVSVSGTPFTNEKGQVIGSIGVVNDISEQRKNLDTIRKKNQEINTLYEAGRLLSQKLDTESIFNTVFDVITHIVDCSELFVAKYDNVESLIRYIYMRSKKGDGPIDVREIPPIPLAPEGFGILSEVIRSGKPVILNDYQETLKKSKTKYNIEVSENGGNQDAGETKVSTETGKDDYKPLSAVIIPIKFENEVLGAIQLYSGNQNAYNAQQLIFLEAFIQQASFAYHNATLYQQAQDEIKDRITAEEFLRSALEERELLLKEIYHRVKNNLQVVSSLLKMQADKIPDPQIKKYFLDSKDRVSAISLIHEKLYRMRDLSRIDFTDYIFSLVENLKGMHTIKNPVKIDVDAQKLYLPIDLAMPCGLILNELITNALKHAFDENFSNPRIEITFTMTPNRKKYYLAVMDNGSGFPENVELKTYDSLGIKLINTLIAQIDGTVELERGKGSKIIIEFPPSSYNQRV